MTVITIPLDKNPELAALVADKQPADWIMLKASIKAKDDQTLTLRLEECDGCDKPDAEAEDGEEEDYAQDGSESVAAEEQAMKEPVESAGKRLARKFASAA